MFSPVFFLNSTTWRDVDHLGGDRVLLGRLDQVGLGIELDQVGDVGIVVAVEGDQPQLGGEYADLGLAGDLEQVLGIVVVCGDALAVKVVVQMLDLLVAGEQHQPSGAQGYFIEVVQVFVDAPVGDIGRELEFVFHEQPPC